MILKSQGAIAYGLQGICLEPLPFEFAEVGAELPGGPQFAQWREGLLATTRCSADVGHLSSATVQRHNWSNCDPPVLQLKCRLEGANP
jgi:hypothetical protein